MDGHAPANPLRRSLPGTDRVKPERNLGAAKPPSAKSETNLRPSPAQVTEPPYADPHVRRCGRGGAARLPPIPIRTQAAHLRFALAPTSATLAPMNPRHWFALLAFALPLAAADLTGNWVVSQDMRDGTFRHNYFN